MGSIQARQRFLQPSLGSIPSPAFEGGVGLVAGIGDALLEGIAYDVRKPLGEALLQLHLQAVVTGVIAVADIVDGLRVAEFKEWTARIIIAGAGNYLVAVLVEKPMTADIAYICSLYCECGRNLMLDREIPEVC